MSKIRALIVDDEPLAREGIRLHLSAEPDVVVVAECETGEAAVRAILEEGPDLVFLDIQMPGLDGFGVVQTVGPERMPPVVFVTAYDQFALKAFDAHALDYLLKPFESERFGRTLQRAREQIRGVQPGRLDDRLLALLAEVRPQTAFIERFAVRTRGKIQLLRAEEVDWIAAEGNYARLHAGERAFLIRETMNTLERRLDPERFLRIHRSTMVRIDAIKELEPLFQGEYSITLRTGARLTSSRGYRGRLQQILGT